MSGAAGGLGTNLVDMLESWLREVPAPDEATQRSSSAELPLPPSYAPAGAEEPGVFPFTRGPSARMYHDQLWVMGQYSGYGTPAETNARFRRLLEAGQTGLSVALDLPTQMGLDSDHELAVGEVGKVGVPLDTVEDVLVLLDGLPLESVRQMRTSANAIGPIFTAFLVVALDEMGVDPAGFRLMLQNDPLKEFSARGTYIFPPEPSLRFAVDVVEYFASELPHWEPIEFCGYHVRDAGGTAVQEVAVATANGLAYLDEAVRRGVSVEALAHSLFLFLSTGVDVFEEAAKLRAARRIWARILHERYGVARERAAINLFVYTLGGALVAQEPLNNVVRVGYETLAAVLGGVQTLATSSYDEALGLPSPEAAHLALRTQQICAYESGATKVVDPLAGSYYVEDLTDRLEQAILDYVLQLSRHGGAVAAIDSGLIARDLGDAAYRLQQEIDSGERSVVGVSVGRVEAERVGAAFVVPPALQEQQIAALKAVRARRSQAEVDSTLTRVGVAAAEGLNTVEPIVAAVRARATIGEIVDTLAGTFRRHSHSQVRL
ncbi:MAG TPA: methylmalonyl-CoA mutase family protein [Thermoleophilaceae bacterium]|nr:methylmalonyl-CoA mutase family protein [Thermoleophilaceae bacterium]